MSCHPERAVALTCHPETPCDAMRAVGVRVRRMEDGILAVTYVLEGDLDRLRIPASRPSRVVQQLWRHTCCEIFIARDGLPAYHEFNFSPSGEWAGYVFRRYRDGAPLADESTVDALNPHIAVRADAKKLELDAAIRLDRLAPRYRAARLRLALGVVIEEKDGLLSYWAIKHPSDKPDFHDAAAFALELGRPAASSPHLERPGDEVRH